MSSRVGQDEDDGQDYGRTISQTEESKYSSEYSSKYSSNNNNNNNNNNKKWAFTIDDEEVWGAVVVVMAMAMGPVAGKQQANPRDQTAEVSLHVESKNEQQEQDGSTQWAWEFRGTVNTGECAQYQEPSSRMGEAEWSSVVRYVLLGEMGDKQDSRLYGELRTGVELDSSRAQAKIIIRREVSVASESQSQSQSQSQTTTQTDSEGQPSAQLAVRLGSFPLQRVDPARTDQHSPAQTTRQLMVQFSQVLGQVNQDLRPRAQAYDQIKTQMQQVAGAKKEFEDEMLRRFALVLNEKKARIRRLEMELRAQGYSGQQANQQPAERSTKDDLEPGLTSTKDGPGPTKRKHQQVGDGSYDETSTRDEFYSVDEHMSDVSDMAHGPEAATASRITDDGSEDERTTDEED